MTWSRLDDNFYSHPKVIAAGDEAAGYFCRAVSFAGRYNTNGYLREDLIVETLGGRPKARRLMPKLVIAGLMHEHGVKCRCRKNLTWPAEPGWWIHDFLRYNPSKSESDVNKAKTAERRNPTLRAAVRQRDHDMCRYCGIAVNFNDHVSHRGGTIDHIDPHVACGESNMVVACKGCNSRKSKRLPAEAGMPLLPAPGQALIIGHPSTQGGEPHPIRHPIFEHGSDRGSKHGSDSGSGGALPEDETHDTRSVTPGRVGSGSGLGRVAGPPATPRSGDDVNPYLRVGHMDPSRDPALQADVQSTPQVSPSRRCRGLSEEEIADLAYPDRTLPKGQESTA